MTNLTPSELMDDDCALFGEKFLEEPMTNPMPRKDVELPPPVGFVTVQHHESEMAQARADAAAAVALVVERAAENKEQLEIWAHEILEGLAFADVLKIDSYDDNIEAHDMVGRGLVEVIRALAPDAGTAELARLKVDRLQALVEGAERKVSRVEAERDTLAAEVARLTGLVETLTGALKGLFGLLDAGSLYEPQAYAARAALDAAAMAALTPEDRALQANTETGGE